MIEKDKYFRKDPVTAAIVEDIFNRYAGGEPIRSIVDELNGKGLKNNGKPFTYHFINWLLKNRRYLGEYVFRDTVNNEAIPQLVSAEIFDKCQQRLEANSHRPASFKAVDEKYLLTGKFFSGQCGDTMSGISGTGKDKSRYRYYQCMTSKRHKCTKKPITKAVAEKAAFDSAMT